MARRPLTVAVLLGGVLAIAITVAGLLMLAGRPGHPPGPASAATHGLTPLVTLPALAEPVTMAVAPPVALQIPAIGVRTRLVQLGITLQGTLQVPSSTSVAGWYTGSPRPGEIGSSIIAGHIDSFVGPGVFYRLRELHPGDRIYVRQSDGRFAVFRVTAVHQYPKSHFPVAAVYGPVPDAELRLITCGGTFDYATRSYLSNIVVYSTEVSAMPAMPAMPTNTMPTMPAAG
ncbi:MAG TPA: class F sortase [Streptosporangiaceae bacterium]|nr:class F sortase [Streptosporangiaceae bacterium]